MLDQLIQRPYQIVTKPTTESFTNTFAMGMSKSVRKPTHPKFATIDIQYEDECVVISADDEDITLTEEESSIFKVTSSRDKGDDQ